MPPPKKGGKKKRTQKNPKTAEAANRVLTVKAELEEYAKVTKILGDNRVMTITAKNVAVMGRVPGRFRYKRHRVSVLVGDVVLLSLREFQEDKTDILVKYTLPEIKKLYKMGEIPDFFMDTDAACKEDACDDGVVMRDSDDEGETVYVKIVTQPEVLSTSESCSGDSCFEESDVDVDAL
jgi:translation initiation factor 1A